MRSLVFCIFVFFSCFSWSSLANTQHHDKALMLSQELASDYLSFIKPSIFRRSDIFSVSQIDNYTLYSHEKEFSLPFLNNDSYLAIVPQSQLSVSYNRVEVLSQQRSSEPLSPQSLFIHYFHVNERLSLTSSDNAWLYAGAGVTYFDSQESRADNYITSSLQIGFSSFYEFNSVSSLTFDTKIYGTFLGNSHQHCLSENCQANKGDMWLQKHVSLQLNIKF